jgi:glutaminyl-tRNA synthetase
MNTDNLKEKDNTKPSLHFIEQIIEEDLRNSKNGGKVITRFPPEPNGYLHIGHAKSICLNFGLAQKYNGRTNLRYDDTNPTKEEQEYVDSIKADIRWLGFDWEDREYYASDYFQQLYDWAEKMILEGKAYVDDQTAEEIAAQKGTPTEPGQESPYHNRSVEENLTLFREMKEGKFKEGDHVLRAKIDMSSPNMHMRDPLMYRILHKAHHRTGNQWCIYPMYDYAHGQSDYLEGITHSICTLEFEVHRPLYDWFLDQVAEPGKTRPRQIEFARLNMSYTIMSKRRLLDLVTLGHVRGWDDPRMPTVSGLRRRGYTPESIRNFADIIGVAKRDNIIDVTLLEHCVRDDLNKKAPRVMAVIHPLRLVITNYPEGKVEEMETINNPEDERMGTRKIPFTRELFIEQDDFMEHPAPRFFRLSPGNEVRLKSAYIVKCTEVVKDAKGNIIRVNCTYDPASRSGTGQDRKVKATIHWVSAAHAIDSEVRLYDRLFNDPAPDGHNDHDFKEFLNPDSLKILTHCKLEPGLKTARPLEHFQFQRIGYFNVDPDSAAGKLVFNRTVSLKDEWTRIKGKSN